MSKNRARYTPGSGKLADITYSYTSSKNVEATASFLKNCLQCIGIDSLPKLDLGFTGAREFVFAFTDVQYRKVDPSKIDPIIKNITTGAIPEDLVKAGRMHVVFEYAYASGLIMSRSDKKEFSADVSGKVDQFIDIGVKGAVTLADKSTISFEGKGQDRAAFAYKAGYLSRDEDGNWEFHPEEVRRAEDGTTPYVPQRGVVLSVETA